MIRSLLRAVHRLALVPALMLVAVQAAANATPPSQTVSAHLVAQAGLSVGFALNQLALLLSFLDANNSSCISTYGANAFGLGRNRNGGQDETRVAGIYIDDGCAQPYFSGTQFSASTGAATRATLLGQLYAPNGAILGALSQAQTLHISGGGDFTEKGTYKAVAGLGQPPVRVGLACTETVFVQTVYTCQEAMVQDFPALKLSLGTIANVTFTLSNIIGKTYSVTLSGTGAKLATGKLGGLSLVALSNTAFGFKGPHSIVGSGSVNGSSPIFSVMPSANMQWSFKTPQQKMNFSLSTANSLFSKGSVVDTSTHAALATLLADISGTGTVAYSDRSKAKITNWTLSD